MCVAPAFVSFIPGLPSHGVLKSHCVESAMDNCWLSSSLASRPKEGALFLHVTLRSGAKWVHETPVSVNKNKEHQHRTDAALGKSFLEEVKDMAMTQFHNISTATWSALRRLSAGPTKGTQQREGI